MNELKIKLDALVEQYNTPAFIENDPVQFPRAYTEQQDIEIAAFLASTIAWGNRKQILTGCRKMFHDIMGNRPYEFVMSGRFNDIDPAKNIHRTFFGRDMVYMCRGLQFVYLTSNTLAIAFRQEETVWDGFSKLRELDKSDPCKYDFALFGLGESQKRMKP